MEVGVVTTEVIEASEPVRNLEAVELSLAAEKVATSERCATNLGAVAIVCVGCPMLEMCRLRNEAMQLAQEQLATVEATDEYSLTNDTVMFAQSSVTIESEIASVASKEVNIATSVQPEKDRTPKKPSYLERLLDDSVEVVLADSIMDAGEAPSRSDTPVRQSEESLPVKETNGVASSDSMKATLTSESLPIDNETVVSDSPEMVVAGETEVEAEVTAVVAVDELERSNIEIPHSVGEEVLIVSSDSKALVAKVNPVIEAVIDIIPTSTSEVVLTALTAETIVTTTTITEAIIQPLRFEPSQISEYSVAISTPEEVRFEEPEMYIEAEEPVVLKGIDEQVTESVAIVATIDTQPADDEAEGTNEDRSAISIEQLQAVGVPEDITTIRRRHQPLEINEVILPVDVLVSALIDSDDTIDPELRLSDTTAMHHLAIGMLRRLALQALRGLLFEGRGPLASRQ